MSILLSWKLAVQQHNHKNHAKNIDQVLGIENRFFSENKKLKRKNNQVLNYLHGPNFWAEMQKTKKKTLHIMFHKHVWNTCMYALHMYVYAFKCMYLYFYKYICIHTDIYMYIWLHIWEILVFLILKKNVSYRSRHFSILLYGNFLLGMVKCVFVRLNYLK